MVNLDVLLERGPQGSYAYFGGHTIKGTVTMTSNEAHKARGLYVEVYGKARAHWSTGSGKSRKNHVGEEVYINSRTYLFGQHGGETLEIQPGVHKYNFAFSLPRELPYSLDIPCGEILYHIKCVLDIPWAFDKEVKVPFTVISLLDLNLHDQLKVPRNYESNETFFTFSNDSGPLKTVVSLPFTGFVPGQEVPFTINYVNNSSIDVERTKVKFKQVTTFSTNSKNTTKENGQDFPLPYLQGVKAHSAETITGKFQIPHHVMATNETCEVITVRYYLKVKAEVSGFHTSPKISVPITIGNVALGASYQPNVELHAPTAPMNPLGPIAPTAPFNDADLPPPFEVAVNMPKMDNSNGWGAYEKS